MIGTHLAKLRASQQEAETLAQTVLRNSEESNAAKWRRGIAWNERQLTKLFQEIAEAPVKTEAGLRARLQVWCTVLVADDADRMLDSIIADTREHGRTWA